MRGWAVLTLALAILLDASSAWAERRIAVVLGNNRGGFAREPLRYAVRDAKQVAAVLESLGGIENTYLLADERPSVLRDTWSRIQDALEREPGAITVFFYYSGHADERGFLMGGERYEFEELRATLERMPSRLFIAVIDACQAGALARTKGGSAVPIFDVDIRDSGPEHRGGVYITSGASGEAAQESDEIESSFFTHYLVSGLRGAADESGDRRVSLEEAYRFAYVHTLERTRGTLLGPQHPTYDVNVAGHGQLVLTWLAGDRSYLVLPAGASGRYYVRSLTNAEVSAEVKKAAGEGLRIALEPGSYEVLRVTGDRGFAGAVDIPPKRELLLDESRLLPRPLDRFAAKGGGSEDGLYAGYHGSSGYLTDAGLVHGARLGGVRVDTRSELAIFGEYGESRYTRGDGVGVRLRAAGGGGAWRWRFPVLSGVHLLAGGELALDYVAQRGTAASGVSETRQSLVVPAGLSAGAEVELGAGLALRALAVGRVVLREGADGFGAPLTGGLELGLRFTP